MPWSCRHSTNNGWNKPVIAAETKAMQPQVKGLPHPREGKDTS